MKQVLTYVVLFLATLLLAAQVMLLLFVLKPGAFTILAGTPAAKGSTVLAALTFDSLRSIMPDSLREALRDSLLLDSLQLARATSGVDSIKLLHDRLEVEIQRAAQLEQRLTSQSASADSSRAKERKGIAKMLESMSPEDAARILKNMKTDEARKVLMTVKKRQAGKILSAMEPRLAAKMMR